ENDIRKEMGMSKQQHIHNLLKEITGDTHFLHEQVETINQTFEIAIQERLESSAVPFESVLQMSVYCLQNGIKIGSTTGYTQHMMQSILPVANFHGYMPECVITSEQVGGIGRPKPWMIHSAMQALDVYPPQCVIKVGDTTVDIEEGKNAGVWSIGVVEGGNLIGLSEEIFNAQSEDEKRAMITKATNQLVEAGADYVIRNLNELPEIITQIEQKMAGSV
ncbi:MAG: phosphonoacetaldehyde hydrolase, partial [Bacilli bacterium]